MKPTELRDLASEVSHWVDNEKRWSHPIIEARLILTKCELALHEAARTMDTAYAAGAAQQRETDARLCDEYPLRDPAEYGNAYSAATECAKAIRETS